jgi:integrase/recombinase XerD
MKLPEAPTEEEIRQFYQSVWNCRNFADMVLIKTLFYTGVRVSELVLLKVVNVDLERCQIRVESGKGQKDRMVPFPTTFRELLGMHIQQMRNKGAIFLFESVR